MIAQTQAALAMATGGIASIGSSATAFALAHPAGLGLAVGVGAYYAANKYLVKEPEEKVSAPKKATKKASATKRTKATKVTKTKASKTTKKVKAKAATA